MTKRDKIVGLSVAHTPKSPGAGYDGNYEHAESIIWTGMVRKHLEGLGYKTITAPVAGLIRKTAHLNQYNIDACLEIHFNSAGNTDKVTGCETLYCPGSAKGIEFAEYVHEQYAPKMGVRDRGVKPGWYKMDRTLGKIDYFLKATHPPALILEPDFISNIKNIRKRMPEATKAIALGIHFFLVGRKT